MSVVVGGCPVLERTSELLIWAISYSIYGMQRMCHIGITGAASKRLCDATARLQTSLSYMITGMMYTLYNLILVGRDIQKFQIP